MTPSAPEREDVFLRKYLAVKRTAEAEHALAVTYGDGVEQVRRGGSPTGVTARICCSRARERAQHRRLPDPG